MKLDPRLKLNLKRASIIILIWMVFSVALGFYNHSLLLSVYSDGPSEDYSLTINILISALTGLLAGIAGSTLLVFGVNESFRKRSFGFMLASTAVIYAVVFVLISVISSFAAVAITYKLPLIHPLVLSDVLKSLTTPVLISMFFIWGFVLMITQFFLLVSNRFGQGTLWKFIQGKYHAPLEEDRIFMFLDIRSSTAIAEKIGHKKYFNFLSDFFADITNAIISSRGEIYQYVGDEVVVSWTLEHGIDHYNCIECFYRIQNVIDNLAEEYKEKYGIKPEFKAGIHYGKVTAGEIGILKRDIVYSGDVLNTTSRIQEQCNQFKVDLLLSKGVLQLLNSSDQYNSKSMGEFELRGREEKLELMTIKQ